MENDLIHAEVDGESLLIDAVRGISLYLNETGTLIYKLLKNGKSEEEIKKSLLDEFDVDLEEAEQDIREFINLLNEKTMPWGKKSTLSRR